MESPPASRGGQRQRAEVTDVLDLRVHMESKEEILLLTTLSLLEKESRIITSVVGAHTHHGAEVVYLGKAGARSGFLHAINPNGLEDVLEYRRKKCSRSPLLHSFKQF